MPSSTLLMMTTLKFADYFNSEKHTEALIESLQAMTDVIIN